MSKHLFRLRDGNSMLAGHATEAQYNRLAELWQGVVPQSLIVTHIGDDDAVDNSPVLQYMDRNFPRLKVESHSWFTGTILCDVHWSTWLKEKMEIGLCPQCHMPHAVGVVYQNFPCPECGGNRKDGDK